MINADSTATRLGLFYAAYFAVIGVLLPYWPLWLESRGLSPVAIGTVLAVTFWVKIVAHPLMAGLADARGAAKTMTVVLSSLAVAVFLAHAWAGPIWSFLLLAVLVGFSFQTILPLAEALALSETKARGLDYGRIRIWGSIAFIAATFLAGSAVEAFDQASILKMVVGGLVLLVLSCALLPRASATARKPWSWPAARNLVTRPSFLLFVVVAGCVQASHGVYYGFGTIAWRSLGIGETEIGVLWAIGVVAEIALFWVAARLGRFGSARALLAAAAVGAILRWPLTAVTDHFAALAVLQLLHGLTFGAAHLGAMRYLQDNAPPGLEATAQAFYYALVSGVIMGLAMPSAGWLYDQFALSAYHTMGALGAIALCGTFLLGRIGQTARS